MKAMLRPLAAAALLFFPLSAHAQDEPASTDQLRVYVDCEWRCDMDFFRTEIPWIDYMRDRADAQVHILVASESTGGGGRRHTFEFIGLRDFAGVRDTLLYHEAADETSDTRRRGMARVIKIGLMRYVASTPLAQRINIDVVQPGGAAAVQRTEGGTAGHDPWNFWTFRLGLNGFTNGESSRNSYRISSSVNANRTTEDWKLSFTVRGNYNEQSFTFPIEGQDTTITSVTRSYSASTLTVRSLGPHLSAGARTSISTSTYGNTSLSISAEPAVEYNIFPYSESTRRQLTALYTVGIRSFEYRDTTIYGQIEETRPLHSVSLGYATRQPWGSINLAVDGSQYLHETDKYSTTVYGGLSDIRLFKGFSLNLNGNYSVVRDQITLARGNRTQDEVLLRQRELATSYRYYLSLGLSYRFGSIFNNVVNPRFGGSGGGGGIMIFM